MISTHETFTYRGKQYRIWQENANRPRLISSVITAGGNKGANSYLKIGSVNYKRVLAAFEGRVQ